MSSLYPPTSSFLLLHPRWHFSICREEASVFTFSWCLWSDEQVTGNWPPPSPQVLPPEQREQQLVFHEPGRGSWQVSLWGPQLWGVAWWSVYDWPGVWFWPPWSSARRPDSSVSLTLRQTDRQTLSGENLLFRVTSPLCLVLCVEESLLFCLKDAVNFKWPCLLPAQYGILKISLAHGHDFVVSGTDYI